MCAESQPGAPMGPLCCPLGPQEASVSLLNRLILQVRPAGTAQLRGSGTHGHCQEDSTLFDTGG